MFTKMHVQMKAPAPNAMPLKIYSTNISQLFSFVSHARSIGVMQYV